jgi:citrate lyase alpha subunit
MARRHVAADAVTNVVVNAMANTGMLDLLISSSSFGSDLLNLIYPVENG